MDFACNFTHIMLWLELLWAGLDEVWFMIYRGSWLWSQNTVCCFQKSWMRCTLSWRDVWLTVCFGGFLMSYSIFLRSALGLIFWLFLLSVMASQKGLRHFMTVESETEHHSRVFSACPQPAVLPGKPMMNTLNCNSYISPLDCMICASIRQILCTLHHTKNQHTTMDHFYSIPGIILISRH